MQTVNMSPRVCFTVWDNRQWVDSERSERSHTLLQCADDIQEKNGCADLSSPSTTAAPCEGPARSSMASPKATNLDDAVHAFSYTLSTAAREANWDGGDHSSPRNVHMCGPGSTEQDHCVRKMVLEASVQLSKLLGIEGEETRKRADALEAIVDVHRSDSQMYHEFVSLVSMPSWLLTEV
jgi:hypothetical protein